MFVKSNLPYKMDKNLKLFVNKLKEEQPLITIYTDALTLLAKGTDAGFYQLTPSAVIVANTENEIATLLKLCNIYKLPLTFKAGGTSLSGQTISNSILVELGEGFNRYTIKNDGKLATFGASVRGGYANNKLAKYGRKLGPSPASIASAKIGGIVANNASGSSYGITYNSYHTIKGMRIILYDGTILDTNDEQSRRQFKQSHTDMCNALVSLSQKAKHDEQIRTKIQKKYELKNTCGYGVNSLIDFDDPIDILQHLMVGSEGTLGFISDVTFATVPNYKLKATALIFFPHIRQACEAIKPLRACSVSAAELMDRNALRAVENLDGMPSVLKQLDNDTVALLIDTSADNEATLQQQMLDITSKLNHIDTVFPIEFTTDINLYNTYWRVRQGLFTTAAATRPKGTACIIEDLAFSADVLSNALVSLQNLLHQYGYDSAIIWGHLLDGNIHFVLMPDFNTPQGTEHYRQFMFDLVKLALNDFNGSLKAEHGTGRNMAPFVKQEWGDGIYEIMKQIKSIIDPNGILNPGVLLNDDPDIFVKNLKKLPAANDLIDKCIECGFCEVQCPSRNLTLTPRQRIIIYRQLTRLKAANDTNSQYYKQLLQRFDYNANATCATDGLCEQSCPVGINTGKLIKTLRWQHNSKFTTKIAGSIAKHMAGLTSSLRILLKVPHGISKIIGYKTMEACTRFLYRISGRNFPLWTRYTPSGNSQSTYKNTTNDNNTLQVVYFPSCINRTMGTSPDYNEKVALTQKTEHLLHKAQYTIIYPENIKKLCCGMAFDSKGFKEQGMQKAKELEAALLKATDNGRIPVLCDMSPCLYRMKETLDKRLKLYEPVEFILEYLKDKLIFNKLPIKIAIHSTCSTTKMGLDGKLLQLASMCADEVVIPDGVGCCAWAGDRGFFYPELNMSALATLKKSITPDIKEGYSTSRTCEIGLSMNSNISYKSIVYLVDKVTQTR